jgi:hypothetical protein
MHWGLSIWTVLFHSIGPIILSLFKDRIIVCLWLILPWSVLSILWDWLSRRIVVIDLRENSLVCDFIRLIGISH